MNGSVSVANWEDIPEKGQDMTIGDFKEFLNANDLNVPDLLDKLGPKQPVTIAFAEVKEKDSYFKFNLKFTTTPSLAEGVLFFKEAGIWVEYGNVSNPT